MKTQILAIAIASLLSGAAFAQSPVDLTAATSASAVGSQSSSLLNNVNGSTAQTSSVSAGNITTASEFATHTFTLAPVYAAPVGHQEDRSSNHYQPKPIGFTTVDSGLVVVGTSSTGGTTAKSTQSLQPTGWFGYSVYPLPGVSGSVETFATQTGSATSTEAIK